MTRAPEDVDATGATRRRVVRSIVLAGAGALALALGACSSSTTATTTPSTSVASPSDSGDAGSGAKKVFKQDQTDIKIGTGETFAIRLPANPSIGDGWDLVSQPDDSFVKADGSSFKAEANAEPGAPGQMEFKFKARKAGTTTVTFMQCERCGGEGTIASTVPGGAAAQRLTFTISVG